MGAGAASPRAEASRARGGLAERVRAIQALRALIRDAPGGGGGGDGPGSGRSSPSLLRQRPGLVEMLNSLAPAAVVVAPDPGTSKRNVVLVGINAPDRPSLLHDISKALKRLSLQCLHSEAAVVGLRSVGVWRCEVGGGLRAERRRREGVDETDLDEIWWHFSFSSFFFCLFLFLFLFFPFLFFFPKQPNHSQHSKTQDQPWEITPASASARRTRCGCIFKTSAACAT